MQLNLIEIDGERLTDEREKNEEEEEGGISFKKIIDRSIENGDKRNKCGENDLCREDAIDLADETPSKLILAEAETWVKGFTRFEVEFLGLGTCVSLRLRPHHLFLFAIHNSDSNNLLRVLVFSSKNPTMRVC